MRVAFCADASVQNGTVRVMRCLAIADVLRAQGVQMQCHCRRQPGDLGDLILERDPALSYIPDSGSVAEVSFLTLVRDLAWDWLVVSGQVGKSCFGREPAARFEPPSAAYSQRR